MQLLLETLLYHPRLPRLQNPHQTFPICALDKGQIKSNVMPVSLEVDS